MRIRPDHYYSDVEVARPAQLAADTELSATLEVTNDHLNWTALGRINFPAPLPAAISNYAYYRIRVDERLPFMVTITVTPAAAAQLVVADVIKTQSTQITRDIDGNVSKITKVGGREIDITRDVDGNVEELTDGTRTWTVGRDVDGNVEEVTVV